MKTKYLYLVAEKTENCASFFKTIDREIYDVDCASVFQSVQHLLTRINEHSRKSTPVGSRFQLCNKSTIAMKSEKLDNSNSQKQFIDKRSFIY